MRTSADGNAVVRFVPTERLRHSNIGQWFSTSDK